MADFHLRVNVYNNANGYNGFVTTNEHLQIYVVSINGSPVSQQMTVNSYGWYFSFSTTADYYNSRPEVALQLVWDSNPVCSITLNAYRDTTPMDPEYISTISINVTPGRTSEAVEIEPTVFTIPYPYRLHYLGKVLRTDEDLNNKPLAGAVARIIQQDITTVTFNAENDYNIDQWVLENKWDNTNPDPIDVTIVYPNAFFKGENGESIEITQSNLSGANFPDSPFEIKDTQPVFAYVKDKNSNIQRIATETHVNEYKSAIFGGNTWGILPPLPVPTKAAINSGVNFLYQLSTARNYANNQCVRVGDLYPSSIDKFEVDLKYFVAFKLTFVNKATSVTNTCFKCYNASNSYEVGPGGVDGNSEGRLINDCYPVNYGIFMTPDNYLNKNLCLSTSNPHYSGEIAANSTTTLYFYIKESTYMMNMLVYDGTTVGTTYTMTIDELMDWWENYFEGSDGGTLTVKFTAGSNVGVTKTFNVMNDNYEIVYRLPHSTGVNGSTDFYGPTIIYDLGIWEYASVQYEPKANIVVKSNAGSVLYMNSYTLTFYDSATSSTPISISKTPNSQGWTISKTTNVTSTTVYVEVSCDGYETSGRQAVTMRTGSTPTTNITLMTIGYIKTVQVGMQSNLMELVAINEIVDRIYQRITNDNGFSTIMHYEVDINNTEPGYLYVEAAAHSNTINGVYIGNTSNTHVPIYARTYFAPGYPSVYLGGTNEYLTYTYNSNRTTPVPFSFVFDTISDSGYGSSYLDIPLFGTIYIEDMNGNILQRIELQSDTRVYDANDNLLYTGNGHRLSQWELPTNDSVFIRLDNVRYYS